MPQVKEGVVVSAKMKKTVVVKVNMKVKHPIYKKNIHKTKKKSGKNRLPVPLPSPITTRLLAPLLSATFKIDLV